MLSKQALEMAVLLGAKPIFPGFIQYYKWLSYLLSKPSSKDSTEFLTEQKVLEQLKLFFDENWICSDIKFIEEYIKTHPLNEIKKSALTIDEYSALILKIQSKFGDYDENSINEISEVSNKIYPRMTSEDKYDSMSICEAFIFDFEYHLDYLSYLKMSYRRNQIMDRYNLSGGPSRICR